MPSLQLPSAPSNRPSRGSQRWQRTEAEWYPAGEVRITNLPVVPGDGMYCLICADTTAAATVYFRNEPTGVGTRFAITPRPGTARDERIHRPRVSFAKKAVASPLLPRSRRT